MKQGIAIVCACLGIAAAVPPSVQSPDSAARWRADIAVARDQFLPRDRSYSASERAEATRRLDFLSVNLPSMTDQQIVAGLARVAALAGNGHTRAYLLRNRGWWRRYPIRIWHFADGWYVIAAKPGYERLLGGRILDIGGKPVASAEQAVRPLYAGPPTWAAYMATYTLTSPDALLGTNVIRGDGSTAFTVRKSGKTVTASLAPVDEPKRATPEESWWFLSPAHDQSQGWTQVLAGKPLPEYLARPNLWYDLRQCDGNVLYMQFNRSEDQPGQPSLQDFGRTVLSRVAQQPGARLIVDLRFNTGGNLQKTKGLFEALARSPVGQKARRLFVIIGPSTFSAGITPAAILKASSKARLVGTEPGDRMTFWAEGGNVTLPNSGISLHYADRAHVYGPGEAVPESLVYLRIAAGSLKPDLPAYPTFAQYLAGRDPATEHVIPSGLRCRALT